jgi:hypothetical protein
LELELFRIPFSLVLDADLRAGRGRRVSPSVAALARLIEHDGVVTDRPLSAFEFLQQGGSSVATNLLNLKVPVVGPEG